ncbi:hypothetical protein QJS66_04630 [Kocuria rhizophila]|nr:hypothetical protein QJS66_04630 [Kocuria rhizophila]
MRLAPALPAARGALAGGELGTTPRQHVGGGTTPRGRVGRAPPCGVVVAGPCCGQ